MEQLSNVYTSQDTGSVLVLRRWPQKMETAVKTKRLFYSNCFLFFTKADYPSLKTDHCRCLLRPNICVCLLFMYSFKQVLNIEIVLFDIQCFERSITIKHILFFVRLVMQYIFPSLLLRERISLMQLNMILIQM